MRMANSFSTQASKESNYSRRISKSPQFYLFIFKKKYPAQALDKPMMSRASWRGPHVLVRDTSAKKLATLDDFHVVIPSP
jgi:hypothetical protein